MKKIKKLKLGIIAMAAVLATGATAYGVYAAANETVQASAESKVSFEADKYVDATVEVVVNGVTVATFTFDESDLSDNEQSMSLAAIYRNSNDDKNGWVRPDENKIAEQSLVEFVITNTSSHSDFAISAGEINGAENLTLSYTAGASELAQGASTTYSYLYSVTGLDDVDEVTQNYVFTFTTK